MPMVKGVSRRVVVVRPDTHDIFEQAIFLVKDSTMPRGDIVQEACRVANRYLLTGTGRKAKRKRILRGIALFLAGAATASFIWFGLFNLL